jgi:hypothetical protein
VDDAPVQLVRANGVEACRNLLAVLRGERPAAVVNPEVWSRPGFQQKLAALPAFLGLNRR